MDEATQALKLISLPDVQTRTAWQLRSPTQRYSPSPYASAWSPDGSTLLVYGFVPTQADSALFVLRPD